MQRTATGLLAILLLVTLTSCLTTNSNHGSAVGKDKTAVGAEVNLMYATAVPDTRYATYRVNAVHGFSDTFEMGLSLGRSSVGTGSYYSAGARVLWALPNDTGALTFDASVDYYFGLTSGNAEADDYVSAGKMSLVQPGGSVAYSFLNGDLRPFVGLHLTPVYVTAYGGIDFKLGPIKPSVLAGAIRPTISTSDSEVSMSYFLEPGLAFEF